MKKLISISSFMMFLLLPLACKKDDPARDKPPVPSGNVTGQIVLPDGISAEGLTVVTSFGEFNLKNNQFSMPEADLDTYRQLYLGDTKGNILLLAVQFPGQTNIRMDAASTADAMVMLNPVVASLDIETRKRLLVEYQKQPKYPELVKKISTAVSAGKSPLDPGNEELLGALNAIHRLGVKDGKQGTLRTSGLISDNDVIEKRIVGGNKLGLKNKRSGITYMARTYDENDRPYTGPLDLGQLRTANTSIQDLFSDTFTYITNFGECNDNFGTKEVPAFCNKFFQNQFPEEVFFEFKTAGKYKVKVANPLASDRAKDLAAAATLQTLALTMEELIGMTDIRFFQRFLKSGCYQTAAGKIADEGLKKLLAKAGNLDLKTVVGVLNETVQDLMSQSGKCYVEEAAATVIDKKWLAYLDKVSKAVKRLDAFSKVGTVVNTVHVANGILFHKDYYEFCVKYDGSTLAFCEELVETIGAKNITASSATLQGRINFLNSENIVRFGFLVGSDPSRMVSTTSLIKNVSDMPGGLKAPHPFDMSFTFQSREKVYYQAFAENELGIVHRGQVMEFTPEQPGQGSAEVEAAVVGKGVGDPHLTTFDGKKFGFMATGEFIAAKSTVSGDRFEVQVRQQEIKSKNNDGVASFNTAIAIHTGSDKVSVLADKKIYINDQLTTIKATGERLRDGGSVNLAGALVSVKTPAGDLVEVQLYPGDLDYYIWPNPGRKGKLRGLQGNFDGNAQNDLMTAGGQVVGESYDDLYKRYAPGWRITQANSLFTYATGTSTATYTDTSYPRKQITITGEQRAKARTVCENAGVTDPQALESCIEDVALTGDAGYAGRARNAENKKMLTHISIADFSRLTPDFALNEMKVAGSNLVPGEEGGSIALRDNFYIQNGFESEYSFTLTDEYAPNAGIRLGGDFDSQNDLGFRIGVDLYQFSYELDGLFFDGEKDVDLFDGKKHRIKTVVRQRQVSGRFEYELQLFIDEAAKPLVFKSDPTEQPVLPGGLPNVLKNVRLGGAGVTIHSWTMKAL